MKADTLTARWSRHRDHGRSTLNDERGDVIYEWGDGCKKSDGSVLHTAIGTGRWSLFDQKYDRSLLEELHARGYDLTTLRFSIRKRKSPAVGAGYVDPWDSLDDARKP